MGPKAGEFDKRSFPWQVVPQEISSSFRSCIALDARVLFPLQAQKKGLSKKNALDEIFFLTKCLSESFLYIEAGKVANPNKRRAGNFHLIYGLTYVRQEGDRKIQR